MDITCQSIGRQCYKNFISRKLNYRVKAILIKIIAPVLLCFLWYASLCGRACV